MADKDVKDPGEKHVQQGTTYQQVMHEFEDFVEERQPNIQRNTGYEQMMVEFDEFVMQKQPDGAPMAPQPGSSSTHGTVSREDAQAKRHEEEKVAEESSKYILTGRDIFGQTAHIGGDLKKDELNTKWGSMDKESRIQYEKIAAAANENLKKFACAIPHEKPTKMDEILERELLDTTLMTDEWAHSTARDVFGDVHKSRNWKDEYLDVLWMIDTTPEEVAVYREIAEKRKECLKNFLEMKKKERDEDTQKVTDEKLEEK